MSNTSVANTQFRDRAWIALGVGLVYFVALRLMGIRLKDFARRG